MNRRRIFALGAAFLALLGLAGYETSVVLQQRDQLERLRKRAGQLAVESATLRRARDADAKDLAEAERQLADLPQPRAGDANVSLEHRTEIKAWLTRVKQLRQLFDERPDQRIPEMQFLTDQDWLRVAKNNELDSDEGRRKAFAAARDAAATRFLPQLSSALRKLARTPPSDTTTIFALTSFCDPPIQSSLLERYELGKTAETPPRWQVQTKAPLDPDYDSRHHVNVYVDGRGYGSGSLGAPSAWIPDFREQSMRAYRAYTDANKGTSAPGLAEALPYFNPPLPPALAEKLLKAERERQR